MERRIAFRWSFKTPDRGVMNFVEDTLQNVFRIDIQQIPQHWIPLSIQGMLDFIQISGTWVWINTALVRSNEAYEYVHRMVRDEIDPDFLKVFRADASNNKFETRWRNIGLDPWEMAEGIPFLRDDVFGSWARQKGLDAHAYTPDAEFLQLVMWATAMWVLRYGQGWMASTDDVFHYTFTHGVAYLWVPPPTEEGEDSSTLLDHNYVERLPRPVGSCSRCGNKLYCVGGAMTGIGSPEEAWENLCVHCLYRLSRESPGKVRMDDPRVYAPACPQLKGNCSAACPHSGISAQTVQENLQRMASHRIEAYREEVRRMGGMTPRQLAGETPESIEDYYRGSD